MFEDAGMGKELLSVLTNFQEALPNVHYWPKDDPGGEDLSDSYWESRRLKSDGV